jgi:hypothetical protein
VCRPWPNERRFPSCPPSLFAVQGWVAVTHHNCMKIHSRSTACQQKRFDNLEVFCCVQHYEFNRGTGSASAHTCTWAASVPSALQERGPGRLIRRSRRDAPALV